MTDIKYLPSVSGLFEIIDNWYDKEGGVDLAWWTKNAIFYYPYLMVSYGGFQDRSIRDNWRTKLGVGKDIYVMGDSGGFQAVQRVIKESSSTGFGEESIPHVKLFEPQRVLDWQCGLTESSHISMDAGIILDQPPRGLRVEQVTRNHIGRCAEFTKKNIEEIEERIGNSQTEIYGVLQGITIDELETWWDIAVEPFDFNSICFSPRVNKPIWLAKGLSFLNDREIENVHLLGLSSFKQQAFISYCRKLDFNRITYDSSAFGKITGFGAIYTPYLTKARAGFRAEKDRLDMSRFYDICDCPVCSYARKYKKIYTKIDKDTHLLLDLHNLYQIIKFQLFLDWLADSEDSYVNFLHRQKWGKVMEGTNFIDRYLEIGFEDACDEMERGRIPNQQKLEWKNDN